MKLYDFPRPPNLLPMPILLAGKGADTARERVGVTECSRRLFSLSPRGEGFSSLRANGQSRVHARDALLPEVAGPIDKLRDGSGGSFLQSFRIAAERQVRNP